MMDNLAPIVVATDLSGRSDRAIDRALLIARATGARLRVVHVVRTADALSDVEALEASVRAVLPDPSADVDIVITSGSPPAQIVEAGIGAGLIVTGVARYNQPGDYLLGTAVDHIIRQGTAPVLVVKQRPHHDYRRILAASDLSPSSRDALLTAMRLFPEAEVRFVHAYALESESVFDGDDARGRLMEETEKAVRLFLDDGAIPIDLRHRIDAEMRYGLIETVIDKSIATFRPDLVVLGTQGKGAIARAFVGSVAEQLLARVSIDTLVVRAAP